MRASPSWNITTAKPAPCICIADPKPITRKFMSNIVGEFGPAVCECAHASDLRPTLRTNSPRLVFVNAADSEAEQMLNKIASAGFKGKVGLFGPSQDRRIQASHRLGEHMGLAMLPVLSTPIAPQALRQRLAAVIPEIPADDIEIDLAEALNRDWVELWYQPKFDVRTLQITGMEALARVRHPEFGVLLPKSFLPDKDDPYLRVFSEFVVTRALDDWKTFFSHIAGLDVAVNLPMMFFEDSAALDFLSQQLPDYSSFGGLIVEIDAADVVLNVEVAQAIAKRLRKCRISTSIDDFAREWPALSQLVDFPFAEIKVDRQLVAGCSNDRSKRLALRRVLKVAHNAEARVVAEGVENESDLAAVRQIGCDLVQGFLLGRPMSAPAFAMSTLPARVAPAA
jgi:EAL domain-containing protein (putative c-di-GMP-specific phosphodiesterase class I)